MKKLINPRTGVLILIILSAAAWRILMASGHSSLSNFTPVGAMALFAGFYFKNKWKAYLVPLLTLWCSDLLLCYFVYYHKLTWFYDGFLWTYGSFALMVTIGSLMKKVNVINIIVASLIASGVHLILTDLGVWLSGSCIVNGQPYTKDFSGLMNCYYQALPYMGNMLIGNLVFGAILFGGFELAQRKYPALQISQQQ